MGEAAEVREARPAYGAKEDRVPPGYKRTDVGVIPEGWEVLPLDGLDPYVTSGSRGWAEFYSEVGQPFLRISNVRRRTIYLDLADVRYVDTRAVDSAEAHRTQLRLGDILISITADIGIIGFVDDRIELPAYLNQHLALVRVQPGRADTRFLAYWLASNRMQRLFISSQDVGAKSGMNLTTVRALTMALPPLPEQRAIARALSDVDDLISALDKLIEKKRAIKQATMQQLLTGRTRLPGFGGEWAKDSLGSLATFLSGGTPSRANKDYWSGTIPWISATSLRSFEIWRSDASVTEEAVRIASRMAPVGASLLLVRGSALHNEILCGLVTKPVCFNQDVKALVPHARLLPRFLTWAVHGRSQDLLKLVSSAGNTAGVLDTKLLKSFEFDLPPLPEQRAIATVLSDMDAEIAALERRREKTRLLKQGMMQELLTGRIRLVETADKEVRAE